MTVIEFPELPFRATSHQACDWLAHQTSAPWTLARMLEHGLTPLVWLDHDPNYPALFGEANGGYPAPIFFEEDIRRLAAGSEDVLITITKDVHKIVTRLEAPGFRRALHELRFLRTDLERLVKKIRREAESEAQAVAAVPAPAPVATESRIGINREQVLTAFSRLLKMDLEQALDNGLGIFGDDGSRIKSTTRKAKNKIEWHPVTLALGLNGLYRVPLPQLRRAFATHDFLHPWIGDWDHSLALLGK